MSQLTNTSSLSSTSPAKVQAVTTQKVEPQAVKTIFIPEITSLVVQYLGKSAIASCTLVSHAWSQAFTSHLWRSINTSLLSTPTLSSSELSTYIIPLHELLRKFGGYITRLTITDQPENPSSSLGGSWLLDTSTHIIFDCDTVENLVHLTTKVNWFKKWAIRSMLHRNRATLRILWLMFAEQTSYATGPVVSEYMIEFPDRMVSLHSLYLDTWHVTRRELLVVLKACPALKLLSLANCSVVEGKRTELGLQLDVHSNWDTTSNTGTGTGTKTDKSTRKDDDDIQLDIDLDHSFQHRGIETFRMCSKLYPLLQHLPNITTLEFYRFDRRVDPKELTEFCASIRQYCPHLQVLLAYGFECSMLPAVLDSIPGLITFRGSTDPMTVLSMLSHASTLEEANFSDYTERTLIPLRFLEMCPRLRSFLAGNSSTTIAEVKLSLERGWACHGTLTELRLYIFKLSPVLIDAIMRGLKTKRELDCVARRSIAKLKTVNATASSARSNNNNNKDSNGNSTLKTSVDLESQEQQLQRQQWMALSEEQREFYGLFLRYSRAMPSLQRLNMGTGWYRIIK
ncbi:hypothetical protein BG011_003134 [Mortierella polycephala]|uniref:F-box domain-containing protein n=1 Tax=Mortierella polycephala TaxID=41804 RepID=A0A9P6UA60_9FUNG|nr:hypothetical protein BG011_003134 [Mortierella polycephala]